MKYKLINVIPPTSDSWWDSYQATAVYADGSQMPVTLDRRDYAEYVLESKLEALGVLAQVEEELKELMHWVFEDGRTEF